jgi:atypical dual specificity phosphatase
MVLAYLICSEKMTLKEAYHLVTSKRPIARPNKGFLRQLIEFEKQIYGNNSLTEEDVYPLGTKLFMSLNC